MSSEPSSSGAPDRPQISIQREFFVEQLPLIVLTFAAGIAAAYLQHGTLPGGDVAFPILAGLAEEGCYVDGYWADNANIEEDAETQKRAEKIDAVRRGVRDQW